MEWYLKVFKQYADFSGRARRKEYWIFTLVNALIVGVFEVFFFALSFPAYTSSSSSSSSGSNVFTIISLLFSCVVAIYGLAALIPSLAVTVRRLHDTGRSGWYYFIALVPFVGGLILLVFTIEDSQPGINAYGPNPKETPAAF